MERIWLANIPPETTDDELKELVKKYAPELDCTEIRREEGDGTRPAALISFEGKRFDSVGKLQMRLNGIYWKNRKLACSKTVL